MINGCDCFVCFLIRQNFRESLIKNLKFREFSKNSEMQKPAKFFKNLQNILYRPNCIA